MFMETISEKRERELMEHARRNAHVHRREFWERKRLEAEQDRRNADNRCQAFGSTETKRMVAGWIERFEAARNA